MRRTEGPGRQRLALHRPVNFAIKMRNELTGNDGTLFTGRTKVEKALSNEHGTPEPQIRLLREPRLELPIGYVSYPG